MKDHDIVLFESFASKAASSAGSILKKYWGKLSNIESKGVSWNLVTEADKESEERILDMIRSTFPSHDILSEESGFHQKNESELTWIIDPLDGTTNYTHQYPWISISIALAHRNTMIVGVVYNPITEEMFRAALGHGCRLNGNKVGVSSIETLEFSLLATGFAYDRRNTADNNYAEFCHLTNLSQGVRRGGSAALDLAYVAAGRLDGFWERGLSPWDIAAGVVLIREAGGVVTSYEGEKIDLKSGRVLASNGKIHDAMRRELNLSRT